MLTISRIHSMKQAITLRAMTQRLPIKKTTARSVYRRFGSLVRQCLVSQLVCMYINVENGTLLAKAIFALMHHLRNSYVSLT